MKELKNEQILWLKGLIGRENPLILKDKLSLEDFNELAEIFDLEGSIESICTKLGNLGKPLGS
jgi:hypothetical protein